MKKRIYIALIVALFGVIALMVSGNWVILILSVLGQIVTLLIGNVSSNDLDKAVQKTLGVGGLKQPPSDDDDEPSDDING